MPEYCATCFREPSEFKGKLIGGVCPDCYKQMKGKDSVSEEGMPKFESMEALEKFLKAAKQTQEKESKPASKATKKKGREPVDSQPSEKITVANEEVYYTINFYLRDGDTIDSLRRDAKEERRARNDNVIIWLHNHPFGKGCESACREVQ